MALPQAYLFASEKHYGSFIFNILITFFLIYINHLQGLESKYLIQKQKMRSDEMRQDEK